MAKNLFASAKKTAVKKTAAKEDKKVRLRVSDQTFFDNIQKLEKLNAQMKSDKAKADLLSDEVRDVAKEEWLKYYQKTGRNPESVFIEAINGEDTSQVMFIPQDKYITINEEKAELLKETYGEDIVEEKTEFSFDSEMVEKYGSVLSELISNSDEIDEEDKEKIVKAVTKFVVAKGTIDKLKTYGPVNEVFEAVKPVVMLKGPEVIKG
jgi:translation elongation factor EF-G